jgi:hypothetical protein
MKQGPETIDLRSRLLSLRSRGRLLSKLALVGIIDCGGELVTRSICPPARAVREPKTWPARANLGVRGRSPYFTHPGFAIALQSRLELK